MVMKCVRVGGVVYDTLGRGGEGSMCPRCAYSNTYTCKRSRIFLYTQEHKAGTAQQHAQNKTAKGPPQTAWGELRFGLTVVFYYRSSVFYYAVVIVTVLKGVGRDAKPDLLFFRLFVFSKLRRDTSRTAGL